LVHVFIIRCVCAIRLSLTAHCNTCYGILIARPVILVNTTVRLPPELPRRILLIRYVRKAGYFFRQRSYACTFSFCGPMRLSTFYHLLVWFEVGCLIFCVSFLCSGFVSNRYRKCSMEYLRNGLWPQRPGQEGGGGGGRVRFDTPQDPWWFHKTSPGEPG